LHEEPKDRLKESHSDCVGARDAECASRQLRLEPWGRREEAPGTFDPRAQPGQQGQGARRGLEPIRATNDERIIPAMIEAADTSNMSGAARPGTFQATAVDVIASAILHESGFVSVRPDGQRRLYTLRPEPFRELDAWLAGYRRLWEARLDRFGAALEQRRKDRGATKKEPRK
jgi:hypothetical protein